MKKSVKAKLNFLAACLESENRAKTVWNIRKSASENIFEHAAKNVSFPHIRITAAQYSGLAKTLDRHSREKELVFYQHALITKREVKTAFGQVRNRRICSPLIYYPCHIKRSEDSFYIVVNTRRGRINPAVVLLSEEWGIALLPLLEEKLNRMVEARAFVNDDALYHELFDLFKTKFPTINQLHQRTGADIRKQLREVVTGELYLTNELVTCVAKKQQSAQSTIHEIELIANRNRLSAPLAVILGERTKNPTDRNSANAHSTKGKTRSKRYLRQGLRSIVAPKSNRAEPRIRLENIPLPVVMNEDQANAIQVSAQYPLTVVEGPPGTGKSYTIATLALNAYINGQSILVVAQNQHAVDVVRRKLISEFAIDPGLTALGSENGLSRSVKAQILGLLKQENHFDDARFREYLQHLELKINGRSRLETEFSKTQAQYIRPSRIIGPLVFWFRKTFDKFIKPKERISKKFDRMNEFDEEIRMLTAALVNLNHQRKVLKLTAKADFKKSLRQFSYSLTARNSYHQKNYLDAVNFEDVINAVPFWFSSVENLHRLLPLNRELFDLIVIDEASQCNLASCLPALYRGKRAVVVGDTKQLSHFSFISFENQQKIFDRFDIDPVELDSNYRANSVLDYAISATDSSSQITQLIEHFRSHPEIIGFSNRRFYNSSLRVMTKRPGKTKRRLKIIEVPGKKMGKTNPIEADSILSYVVDFLDEQKAFSVSEAKSLGVLSFFTEQAELIEKLIFANLSLDQLQKHDIKVGTPFSFQGEERDQMLISLCVDAETPVAAYTYMNREDVFNVGVTRAKNQQLLFLSCSKDNVQSKSILREYLDYCEYYQTDNPQQTINRQKDQFQALVCKRLLEIGVKTIKDYSVAGIGIDIVAIYKGSALAIDIIGFPGRYVDCLSLQQFKLLDRAGFASMVIAFQEWQLDKAEILADIAHKLGVDNESSSKEVNDKVFEASQVDKILRLSNGVNINQLSQRLSRYELERTVLQLSWLVEKLDRFETVLSMHFTPTEITFNKYQNAFNELFLVCLRKLQNIALVSEQSHSMLLQLKNLRSETLFDQELLPIEVEREAMLQQLREKTKSLMLEVERSILQMDSTLLAFDSLVSDDVDQVATEALRKLTANLALYREHSNYNN